MGEKMLMKQQKEKEETDRLQRQQREKEMLMKQQKEKEEQLRKQKEKEESDRLARLQKDKEQKKEDVTMNMVHKETVINETKLSENQEPPIEELEDTETMAFNKAEQWRIEQENQRQLQLLNKRKQQQEDFLREEESKRLTQQLIMQQQQEREKQEQE